MGILSRLADASRALVAKEEKPQPKGEQVDAVVEDQEEQINALALAERMSASGQRYESGRWAEEYHEDLRDPRARVDRMNELRIGDSVVAFNVLRVESYIIQGRWSFEPPDEPELLPSEQAAMDAQDAEMAGEDGPPKPGAPKGKAKKEPVGKGKPSASPVPPGGRPALLEDGSVIQRKPPNVSQPDGLSTGDEQADPDDPDAALEDAADLAKRDTQAKLANILTANLLGKGPSIYRMRTTWEQYLHEALTARVFGFAVFERTYKRAGEEQQPAMPDAMEGEEEKEDGGNAGRRAENRPTPAGEAKDTTATLRDLSSPAATGDEDTTDASTKPPTKDANGKPVKPEDGKLGATPPAAGWGSAIVVEGLYWLHPRSIMAWHRDKTGKFIGITQEASLKWYDPPDNPADPTSMPREGSEYIRRFIPAERLVVHVRRAEGDSMEGMPEVRHMYADARHGAFLRKCQRADANNRGVSIPRVTLSETASPETKQAAIAWAQRMTSGSAERRFCVDTQGVETGFVDLGSNAPNFDEQLRATQYRMSLVGGTEHALIGGEGASGSYSASQTQASYFNLAIESVAEWLIGDIQRQIVEPLVALNAMDTSAPELTASDLVPNDLAGLIEAKKNSLLTWTEEDEQEYRRRMKWRLLTDEEIAERTAKKQAGEALAAMAAGVDPKDAAGGGNGATTSKPEGKGSSAPPPAAAVIKPPAELSEARTGLLRKTWRAPTEHEATYCRLAEVDEAFDDFERDFVQAMRPLRAEAVDRAIAKAEISGRRVRVPKGSSKAMREEMARLATRIRGFGKEQALNEIARQRGVLLDDLIPPQRGRLGKVRTAAGFIAALEESLETVIDLDVAAILDRVVTGVTAEIVKGLEQGWSDTEAREGARREMLDRSDVELEKMSRDVGSRAFNGGRGEGALASGERLIAIRSEVLDDRTCASCESLDGLRVDVDSDEYVEFMPPNKCDGGAYCRGMYLFETG